MVYVKLTLSSNGLPTYINAETINQIFEDTDKDGKSCTRIEFFNDFTRVSESIDVVIMEIALAASRKEKARFPERREHENNFNK